MITDTYFAHEVEVGDNVVISEDVTAPVKEIGDEVDFITITLTDDDGEGFTLSFAPFDPVEIVTSFDDEEVLDVDVPID